MKKRGVPVWRHLFFVAALLRDRLHHVPLEQHLLVSLVPQCRQVAGAVNECEHMDVFSGYLVDEAEAFQEDFTDGGVTAFRDYAAPVGGMSLGESGSTSLPNNRCCIEGCISCLSPWQQLHRPEPEFLDQSDQLQKPVEVDGFR